MKEFNTTAVCIPEKYYMVDISDKVCEIKKMVDAGKYFTINRARQFGKTTTLTALDHVLSQNYYVVSMDFQDYGAETFRDEDTFCRDFISDFCSNLGTLTDHSNRKLLDALRVLGVMSECPDDRLRFLRCSGD